MLEIFFSPIVLIPLVIGLLISVCAAVLGVILVIKKYSLIGHGLADIGFAAMAIAVALGIPHLYISLPITIAASFIIMSISHKKGVSGDVAIGVTATASLAIGIIVAVWSKGFNTDIAGLMFGNILAVNTVDLIMAIVLAAVVLTVYIVFYNRLFIVTNDEPFAAAMGINVDFYRFTISFLTALTVAIGMKIAGSLLISSLIIFPAIAAKQITKSFKLLVILSAAISAACFLTGLVVSIVANLPIGAATVATNVIIMGILALIGRIVKKRA